MEPKNLWDRIVCLVYPPRCVLCGRVVEYDDMWCGGCAPVPGGPAACALPHRFSGAVAATGYEGAVREAVWRLKDSGDRRAARYFAGEMHAAWRSHWGNLGFDALVPVPARPSKRRNQAALLAEELRVLCGVPLLEGALIRREDSRKQRTLTQEERMENARTAYRPGDVSAIGGRRLLLIDDVFTTGSTAAACTELLLEAGAASVHVLTATAALRREPNLQEI